MNNPIPRSGTPRFSEASGLRTPRDSQNPGRLWRQNAVVARQVAATTNAMALLQQQVRRLQRRRVDVPFVAMHPFEVYQLPPGYAAASADRWRTFYVNTGTIKLQALTRNTADSAGNVQTLDLYEYDNGGWSHVGGNSKSRMPNTGSREGKWTQGLGEFDAYAEPLLENFLTPIGRTVTATAFTLDATKSHWLYIDISTDGNGDPYAEVVAANHDDNPGELDSTDPRLVIAELECPAITTYPTSQLPWFVYQHITTNILNYYVTGCVRYRGEYNAEAWYYPGDEVYYDPGTGNRIYRMIYASAAKANVTPGTDATVWTLMYKVGAT